MQSAVETLSPTRVKLTVEVPFDELKPDLDAAYRRIGKQVKVQGFRPGKVPPRILDQRVGRGAVLDEAVHEALPRLYGEAVEQSAIVPVGRPEVDVTTFEDGKELTFTAEVDVRPEIALPAYDELSVTVEAVDVTDEEVQEQVDALRGRFAKLLPVERMAHDGDYVTIDLAATVDGEDVPGGTATDLSYRVGSGDLLDGIDDVLLDASEGETHTFSTVLVAGEMEGLTAEVAVTVRSVNERELPEADDAWAAESTGFETFALLREDVVGRLDRAKRMQQGVEARDKVLEALLAQVDVPLPDSVVEQEVEFRRRTTDDQLTQAGLTLEDFLTREGQTAEQFETDLDEGSRMAVKAQLVLDAVADKEELGVNEAELTDQVVRRAQRARVSPDEYAQSVVKAGQLPGLVAEVRRGKALATVMEAATIVDDAGEPVDLQRLRDADPDAAPDGIEVDEDGRRYHVHDDGDVHFLDE